MKLTLIFAGNKVDIRSKCLCFDGYEKLEAVRLVTFHLVPFAPRWSVHRKDFSDTMNLGHSISTYSFTHTDNTEN